ncbi:MAG: membrane protein insertion efficiency factor YidD [Methylophilaceae bacterium]|jgi:putative membrane protein insertion efficiency factor|nr:membrane protein insertion efficiency factor YidD [Pseudomonadota bacterium]
MKTLAVSLISIYQRFISPLLPASCIYTPTCSEYAKQSFIKHGFFKGFGLSVIRILKCGPWSKGGLDEVV